MAIPANQAMIAKPLKLAPAMKMTVGMKQVKMAVGAMRVKMAASAKQVEMAAGAKQVEMVELRSTY